MNTRTVTGGYSGTYPKCHNIPLPLSVVTVHTNLSLLDYWLQTVRYYRTDAPEKTVILCSACSGSGHTESDCDIAQLVIGVLIVEMDSYNLSSSAPEFYPKSKFEPSPLSTSAPCVWRKRGKKKKVYVSRNSK